MAQMEAEREDLDVNLDIEGVINHVFYRYDQEMNPPPTCAPYHTLHHSTSGQEGDSSYGISPPQSRLNDPPSSRNNGMPEASTT